MRFAFIEEHRRTVPIDRLCRILDVTSRGYRAWRNRPLSRRQRDDLVLLAHIREQHRLSLGSYGRPRMTEELKEIGLNVGHRRVGRLMRQNGFTVVRTRKYKATTDSNHRFNIVPNLLDRNFTAAAVNRKWAGDISYIWTAEGWLYLAVMIVTCIPGASSVGPSAIGSSVIWQYELSTWPSRFEDQGLAAFITPIVAANIVPMIIKSDCGGTASKYR